MKDKIEKKRLSILRILAENNHPVSSQKITEYLASRGYELSERTVRFHLLAMDREGLTEYVGRQGRQITDLGRDELSQARVYEKVGFLNARIDEMTCLMDFDVRELKGKVIVNTSIIRMEDVEEVAAVMEPVFQAGFCMGDRVYLMGPGEGSGLGEIPAGHVGICTVCSFNANGILVQNGVPMQSQFGGLMEIQDSKPLRFIEVIKYAGTSIEPLEIFIKSRMTDFSGALEHGNGRIGGNFFEVPSICRDKVLELSDLMESAGLGRIAALGWPGHSLLEIPMNAGRIGGILIGGLNPFGAVVERNIPVESQTVSTLISYRDLFHYSHLVSRFGKDSKSSPQRERLLPWDLLFGALQKQQYVFRNLNRKKRARRRGPWGRSRIKYLSFRQKCRKKSSSTPKKSEIFN